MVENIFMFCILALSTGGSSAGEVCEANIYTSSINEYSVYCETGCCGYYYSRQCCPSYVGLIIGAVIGGLCFIGGIVFLICMCYHCNKKKSSVGTVISNNPTGANTTVVGTTQQGVYYQTGVTQPTAAYPPPGSNLAPMTAYPAPPPAYPSPAAGQSNPSSQDQQYPEKH